MERSSLFWAIYKNLEEETLSVFDYVHCTDNQFQVYSMHIADLVVRSVIEIESLSKEIYRNLKSISDVNLPEGYVLKEETDNNFLMFDSDCLNLLNRLWGLDKKIIIIASSKCFLNNEENRCLRPLKNAGKKGKHGALWNKAYQALKHDRFKKLDKGNIKALLHAVGALYLLNIYYMGEIIQLGDSKTSFDASMGSRLFSVVDYDVRNIGINGNKITLPVKNENEKIEAATYILKVDDYELPRYIKSFHEDVADANKRLYNSKEYQEYIRTHPDSANKDPYEIVKDTGLNLNQFFTMNRFLRVYSGLKFIAVLNKNQPLYPSELI